MSPESPNKKPEAFKYWAFICYSHSDEKWATWLHRKLETYRVPKRLVGTLGRGGIIIPKRAFPIFRDREELPGSANLTESIERALRESLYLIVICSPRAVQSKWVDQEIRMFKAWDREDRVLCLIAEGEPNAADHPQLGQPECLPESVKYWVDAERRITAIPTEPIAADARKGKDGKQNALLKIAAGILGVTFEDLRQRDEERRHRVRTLLVTAAAALLMAFVGLSTELYFEKNKALEAQRQAVKDREHADLERKIAESAMVEANEARKATLVALEEQKKATALAEESKKQALLAAEAMRIAKDKEAAERKKATEAKQAALESERKAKDAEQAAVENEKTIRRTLATSDFAAASRLIEEDENGKALAYLSRALRADPENPSVIHRTLSLLSQRNWPMQVLAPFRHQSEVKAVVFSPDGRLLVTVAEGTAHVWDANTGKAIFAPLQHKALVTSVEFSKDGKWLVTASRDHTAQIWNVTDGKPVKFTLKHDDWVNGASFSWDSRFVVTASQDKTAKVWEADTGRCVMTLQHDAPLGSAKFSPDGAWVLAATSRSYARLWDVNTGVPIGGNMNHQGGVTSAVFSPDGKWIATASGDRTARIWQAGASAPVSPPLDHVNWITGAKFSPDGKFLATISSDNTARIWEVPSGKPATPPLKHDGAIASVNFSPNGRWLVTASSDASARIWNTTTGKPVCEPLRHTGPVSDAAFNFNGDKVVTASADHTARIWQVTDNRPVFEPLRHEQWVNSGAFTADGKLVATVSSDRSARIWDTTSGEPVSGLMKHRDEVLCCCFDATGKILLTGSKDATLSAWDIATEKLLYENTHHYGRITSIQMSPDGETFYTGSDDHTVRFWDVKTGKPVGEPLRHETAVRSIALSPAGTWVATAAEDKTARIWDRATGTQKHALSHTDLVSSVAISPDGKWVATGTEDKSGNCVRVWDLQSGKPVIENLRQESAAKFVMFAPGVVWNDSKHPRKWLLTISDKTARVWDAATGKAVTEPLKDTEAINSAAFSPDGNFVVTASDKTAHVWEAATGRLVADPMRHDGTIRFATFSPDGNSLLTGSSDKTARLWMLRLSGYTPTWLSEFVTIVGGYQLADSGATELVHDRWIRLSAVKDSLVTDANTEYGTWAQWFTEDRLIRTTTPFAKTSLKSYIVRRIYEGTPEALERALDFEPNNALALVKVARQTANADQADFLSKLAETYQPLNPDVLWIRAQVLQQVYKMAEAYDVMQRAIARDPRNLSSFGDTGEEIKLLNRDGYLSQGWLPKGWLDNNTALPISVSYSRVTDPPREANVGFGITVDGRDRLAAELRGPRFVCKRSARCTIEGWVRSVVKSDLTVALCQFVEPNDKLKEQTIRTTTEWKPFKIQFVPQQDTAAELRIYQFTGGSVELAGINIRQE